MSERYLYLTVTSRAQWRGWLAAHGASEPGVWVTTWKKGSGQPHVSYDDIVDEAIAAGWVDSRPQRVDENRSGLLVTPRKPASRWSKKNKDRVERLLAAGLMRPEGLAVVEAAKASGTWNALDDVEALNEPDDLSAALDAEPVARAYFAAFPRSAKRAILEWISAAKTPETRAARIERAVGDASLNIRANQWRQPKGSQRTAPTPEGRSKRTE
ncbi:hypothetical protein N865_20375 [Intrasporangium oryzae NRRL B-24470]|uniref:Bacteriocin-protection protein n=1 Tax=Intrasporangium oryzae NRRL B-24470 TaxID=1386089 RepID=W9G9P6_9MICO|nr:YdeI/OmpD-associated family protein [Intrasporangium oryzae]EWT01967.1 hypothetical protein N865_20375 [Intrasporangium oryzae NRRL B-24470]